MKGLIGAQAPVRPYVYVVSWDVCMHALILECVCIPQPYLHVNAQSLDIITSREHNSPQVGEQALPDRIHLGLESILVIEKLRLLLQHVVCTVRLGCRLQGHIMHNL